MSSKIALWVGLIGVAATIPLVQTIAVAKSAVEVQRIAKQVTVKISGCGFGSGVIIRRAGSTYTVLTAAHAVEKSGCQVTTPDDTKYPVANIKTFPDRVDLAVFTFTSSKNYPVAKLIANSNLVEAGENVYVSGYPLSSTISNSIFAFVKGDVVSNSSTKQQQKGYSLIYSNNTLPGHSGGPVWNDKGEVIAIHGQGDVDTKLEKTMNDEVRVKTGYNLGITVNTFTKLATTAGIGGYTPVTVAAKPKPVDDLIASAVSKESKGDYRGILADINRAIAIDSQQARLYYMRGVAKSKLDDSQGAVADYNRAIQLNPNLANAYNNRGLLKDDKLNDSQGAVADYNRAIQLNPNHAIAYNNRGRVKDDKLNDSQGAVADYNRAIQLNPNEAGAYYNRGRVKDDKLNDSQGAVADYNRAIQLSPNFATAYYNRGRVKNDKLNDSQGALADHNRAIQLSPNLALAYNNRGNLKNDKLNDSQGALADYNRAIQLNPNFASAYNNRGFLKNDKLNNSQGALADYNRAIQLNPNFASAYGNRGFLKKNKLNDRAGAIDDMNRVVKIFQQQGNTQGYQQAIDLMKKWQQSGRN
jgi:tetratricopeptide (TPR) repeat protein